jgi:GPH family glycoside/pentoside/hexuronide:cation symporter
MAKKEDCHGYRRSNAIGGSRAAMTAPTQRVPMRTKLFYSCGSIALGIKENGFSIFLLIFYNQVVGLPAGLVSLAIGSALIIDAFVDPLIGNLSDRTKSKWGRRHPWM